MKFFDKFPTIQYDVNKDGRGYRAVFTNFLLRLKILENIKNNSLAYYEFSIPEKDTIEILAEKYYGDPEYHWIIALANDMSDPLFDWPKDYNTFNSYIDSKYGGQANATQQIHHYEMTINRKDLNNQTNKTIVINIDSNTYNTIAEFSFTNYDLDNNAGTIEETISTSIVNSYDWEVEQNEKKRQIKLIKKDYIGQILNEFDTIMKTSGNNQVKPGLRSLRI